MSMINMDDLIEDKQKVLDRKTRIYEEILKKCHHRIKNVSKQNPLMCYCLYIIPKFIYGIPLYNLSECVKYLFEKLIENGFKVYYTHPNLLIISWIHLKEKKKITASSMQSKEYKEIDNYKPSGNLIYNKSNLNVLNSKTNLLFR
jgi:hypothetical protein